MSNSSSTEFPTINICDLDINKLKVVPKITPVVDVKAKIKYCYINYEPIGKKEFGIELPINNTFRHGRSTKNIEDDEELDTSKKKIDAKKKIKISFTDEKVIAKFVEIEEYLNSAQFKKQLNISKYNLKSAVIKMEDEKNENFTPTVNLHIFHNDKKNELISLVFDGSDNSMSQSMVNSIDEFRNIVCSNSTAQFIISPGLWIGNDNTFGIKFTIRAVKMIEFANSSGNKNMTFKFSSSLNSKSSNSKSNASLNDKDASLTEKQSSGSSEKKSSGLSEKQSSGLSEKQSSGSSDLLECSEKNKTKPKPENNDDDDSDETNDSDDSNEKPTFKQPVRRVIPSDDESDDEDLKTKKVAPKSKGKSK